MEQKFNISDEEKFDTEKETAREKIEIAKKVFLKLAGILAVLTAVCIGGPIFWLYYFPDDARWIVFPLLAFPIAFIVLIQCYKVWYIYSDLKKEFKEEHIDYWNISIEESETEESEDE